MMVAQTIAEKYVMTTMYEKSKELEYLLTGIENYIKDAASFHYCADL